MQELSVFISSVGFPITACVALAWYVKNTNDIHRAESAQNRAVITQMNESLIKNNYLLEELIDKK